MSTTFASATFTAPAGSFTEKTWTYTILDVSVEGTQRGYLVSAIVKGGKVVLASCPDDGTKKGIDKAYDAASCTANSVKRGVLVSTYNGRRIQVDGRKLTVRI